MPTHTTLYLIRHAIAEKQGSAWPDDDLRPLSQEGRKKWRRAVAGLVTVLPTLELILVSPLLRATQTADVLAAALPAIPGVEYLDELRPDGSPQATLKRLRHRELPAHVALVGHEPSMTRLAATLLHAQAALEFKKGSVMAISTQGLGARGPGRLEWYATPRMLRAMARNGS